jgi:hypothetical protein
MSKLIWKAELRQNPKTKATHVDSVWRPYAGTYLRIAAEAAPVDVREMLLLTPEHGSEPWDGDKPFLFDFRKLKRTAGKENEFFKSFTYRKNRRKYDKDLVAMTTFEVEEPRAGFMHSRWETRIDTPGLDRQLSAGQHVATELMKIKFPKGVPEKATYDQTREYEWIRTALGQSLKPMKDEKLPEQWCYCEYCGNVKVPDYRQPCNACGSVLYGKLSVAWEIYKTLEVEGRRCCGGLSSDKSHLHYHSKYGDSNYEGTSVEMGTNLYDDHATTYWIFDADSFSDSNEYGDPIRYDDPEFWTKLSAQLDQAAEAAWNSDVCSCEHCGYHYHVGNGPCGCSGSEEEEN